MNLKESIRRILREESKPNPYIIAIRRRLPFISKTRREFIGSVKPCDMTFDDFYEAFEIDVLETYRFEFCDNISNGSNREWEKAMDFIVDYLRENHYEWMREYYDSACS